MIPFHHTVPMPASLRRAAAIGLLAGSLLFLAVAAGACGRQRSDVVPTPTRAPRPLATREVPGTPIVPALPAPTAAAPATPAASLQAPTDIPTQPAMGLYRTLDVAPGHQYTVEAWARYVSSESGLQLYLGFDLGGGEDFEAATVTWFPWNDMTPGQWISAQQTMRAQGDRMTIFLRAVHPLAADGGNKPGGNTMFDDVSVTDVVP